MIKVLIVSTVCFRLNGITSVILNYYRNMNKSDMQIDFVAPNIASEEYRTEIGNNGSRIYFIPRKSNPVAYMIKLYRLMKNNQYDIVHVHGNSATMFFDIWPSVIAKVPVRIVHSHNTTCSYIRMHKMLKPVFERLYTNAIACGQDAGEWLYGDKPFIKLKNGIDLKKYEFNDEIRSTYRRKICAGERVVLGHVGNFTEQKNHTFLLDWFAELMKQDSSYLLLLISDGALMEAMKEKVHSLGIDNSVLFAGKTMEVQNYLQAIDLLVLPSLYEGLPVVLVEAQASGLPCLVADTVAKEADLTNTLKFIPITAVDPWVKQVKKLATGLKYNSRSEICKSNQYMIKAAGYDITENANNLKELYIELYNRSR